MLLILKLYEQGLYGGVNCFKNRRSKIDFFFFQTLRC